MAIGCCSHFKQCSDLGDCVNKGILEFKDCMYKENLMKGLNFYTEYNENNRKRKEEYELSFKNINIELTSNEDGQLSLF